VDEFHTRSEAEYRDALSRFPYPLTIVHGDEALTEYERLKANADGVPVALGGPSEFALTYEVYERALEFEPSTQIILERTSEIVFPDSYRELVARENAAFFQCHPELRSVREEMPPEVVGEWPESLIGDSFKVTAAHDVVSGQAWPRVHIAIIPTSDPTTVPAYLRAGGWNDMPEPAALVAALRVWRQRYGAELVALAYDSMDIRVERTLSSRDEAIELAREHFLFCPDALNEMTLRELAAHLIENDWWFFWWD
jgi:hypothetical protein